MCVTFTAALSRESGVQMKRLCIAGLTVALAASTFAAEEPDLRTPTQRLHGDANYAVLMCSVTLRLALAKSELGEPVGPDADFRTCISKGRAEAKANLDKALKSVKKSKAKEALKDFYVAAMTSIDGVAPALDERKGDYARRQQELESKMKAAWSRFEIEQ